MADVFLSYSRKDTDFVKKLHESLSTEDYEIWVDWEGIPLTADWWAEIEEGIEAADTFVFIISPDSVESQVCGQELDHAVEKNKRIMPVVYRDTKDVPPSLSHLNWIFCRESDDYEASVQALIEAMNTDLDWVKAHTRLTQRTVEWEKYEKHESYLLRGIDLEDAEGRLGERDKIPALTEVQIEYIQASRKKQDADIQRELEQAQALADEQRQRADEQTLFAKRLKRFIVGLVVLLLMVVGALIYSNYQTKVANTRNLVAGSLQAFNQGEYHLSRLLAAEAIKIVPRVGKENEAIGKIKYKTQYVKVAQVIFDHEDGGILSWHPNGRYIAVGSIDGNISLWDWESDEQIAVFERDFGSIYELEWHLNGKYLAVGTDYYDEADQRIERFEIWDWELGRLVAELEGTDFASFFAWHPNGQYLVVAQNVLDENTGQQSGQIIIWDWERDELTLGDKFNNEAIWLLTRNPNAQYLAVGLENWADETYRLSIWDVDSGDEMISLVTDTPIFQYIWHPNGQYIAGLTADGHIIFWDWKSGEQLIKLNEDLTGVVNLVWHPEGQYIALALDDRNDIFIWDWVKGEKLMTLDGHSEQVIDLAWHPDGRYLSSVSFGYGDFDLYSELPQFNGNIIIWDTEYYEQVQQIDNVSGSALHPNDRYLAMFSNDDSVIVWDADRGEQIAQLERQQMKNIIHGNNAGLAWHPNGRYLAWGTIDFYDQNQPSIGLITIWDWERGEQVAVLDGSSEAVLSLDWNPDGQTLAVLEGYNRDQARITIWDWENGKPAAMIGQYPNLFGSLTWHPDGRYLAFSHVKIIDEISGVDNGQVIIWDYDLGKELKILEADSTVGPFRSFVWHPDGHALAAGTESGYIIIWDLMSGKQLVSLDTQSLSLNDLAWHPEGNYLAASLNQSNEILLSGRIIIWDAQTYEQISILEAPTNDFDDLFWNPGDHTLVAESDQAVFLWPEILAFDLCEGAIFNLTIEEWIKYRPGAIYKPTCENLPAPEIPTASFDEFIYALPSNLKNLSISNVPDYFVYTVQGRLKILGFIILVLVVVVAILWGVFTLLRRLFRKLRRPKKSAVSPESV